MDTTIVVIKPEEVASGRAPEIYSAIERYCKENGLELESRSVVLDRPVLERHFLGKGDQQIDLVAKKVKDVMTRHQIPFQDAHEAAMRLLRAQVDGYEGRPAIVVKITGDGAVEKISAIKGSTDPCCAAPGTIRGMFSPGIGLHEYLRGSMSAVRNVIHAPETEEEAAFDIETFWKGASALVDILRSEK